MLILHCIPHAGARMMQPDDGAELFSGYLSAIILTCGKPLARAIADLPGVVPSFKSGSHTDHVLVDFSASCQSIMQHRNPFAKRRDRC